MGKVSVKSVIESGLEKGSSVKVILGQVAKKCPDSKADESHIRFYANKMVREGNMDAEVAATKYGCGKRGRKAGSATKTETPKKEKTSAAKKVKSSKVKKDKPEAKRVKSLKASKPKKEKAEAKPVKKSTKSVPSKRKGSTRKAKSS